MSQTQETQRVKERARLIEEYAAFRKALEAKARGEYFKDAGNLVYSLFDRFGLFAKIGKQEREIYVDRTILMILDAARQEKDLNKRANMLRIAQNPRDEKGRATEQISSISKRIILNDRLDSEFSQGLENISDLRDFLAGKIEDLIGEYWE